MIAALKFMDGQSPKPVLFAHHPSRSAPGIGEYGLTTPGEIRNWNDTAPQVAIGMEGAPGHQASSLSRPSSKKERKSSPEFTPTRTSRRRRCSSSW
jgi:hypothetical protein